MKNLFINKKTINTISHTHLIETMITYDESIISQDDFIKTNRRLIIDIKDTLLNRDNLTLFEQKEKLELLKNSIENGNKLPINYERPIGIRTDDNDKKYLSLFKEKEKIELQKRLIEIEKESIELSKKSLENLFDEKLDTKTTETPKKTNKKK